MTNQLNFAPYSDPPPSPPTPARYFPTASSSSSYQAGAPVSSLATNHFSSASPIASSSRSQYHQSPSSLEAGAAHPGSTGEGGGAHWNTRDGSGMETSLGRHDQEALACYALGPFGAALLLVYETENDYVRFHAFQSVLLAAVFFITHLFFLLLITNLGSFLFLLYIIVCAFMSWKAYRDSDLLDRFHVPYLGPLAQKWVEEE